MQHVTVGGHYRFIDAGVKAVLQVSTGAVLLTGAVLDLIRDKSKSQICLTKRDYGSGKVIAAFLLELFGGSLLSAFLVGLGLPDVFAEGLIRLIFDVGVLALGAWGLFEVLKSKKDACQAWQAFTSPIIQELEDEISVLSMIGAIVGFGVNRGVGKYQPYL